MSAEIKLISTPDAPAAKGPYSQGMVHGDYVFVAGQLPLTLPPARSFPAILAPMCVRHCVMWRQS